MIPQPVLDWLGNAVLQSDRTEQATRERISQTVVGRSRTVKCTDRTMYLDKVDGRITAEFFDQRAAAWRREQATILRKDQRYKEFGPGPGR